MKKITITIVMVFALMAMLTAFEKHQEEMGRFEEKIHPGGEHMMREGFGGLDRICDELELTDKQIEKMEAMRLAHKKEMIGTHADIDIIKVDKRSAMKNHDFDKTKKITAKLYDLKKAQALLKQAQSALCSYSPDWAYCRVRAKDLRDVCQLILEIKSPSQPKESQ